MRGFVTCYLGLTSTFYPSLQHSDGASVAEDVFPLVVVAFSTQLRLANSSATAAPPPPTQSNKPRQFFTNFPCSRFLHVLTLVLRQAYPTMTCIKCFKDTTAWEWGLGLKLKLWYLSFLVVVTNIINLAYRLNYKQQEYILRSRRRF